MEIVMSGKKEEIFDVFLSYSHKDTQLVEELAERLEDNAQLRVWLDRWNLIPGERWQQEIARGFDHTKSCAICIGKETPRGWFREEIDRALNRQTKDTSFRVIPVLLPNAQKINIDDFLELRTWVDFKKGLDDSRAFYLLISGIRGVVPGRGPHEEIDSESPHILVREKLILINKLRKERLLDDVVAIEYQGRLLDRYIVKSEDSNERY